MLVYHPMGRRNASLFVTPAKDPRAISAGIASDWIEGGEAKNFAIEFRSGCAHVPDSVGNYLLATGQAKRTSLILPQSALAA
jgi:hypothetical protein